MDYDKLAKKISKHLQKDFVSRKEFKQMGKAVDTLLLIHDEEAKKINADKIRYIG
ncbi:MAG: hypothetical protein ABIE55_03680 [Candidatus Aenigmatarchaeota archaeon]